MNFLYTKIIKNNIIILNLNIMVLYLNNKNFLQVSKILFTLLLFTTSCQLDQSLDNIRGKLFESEEGKAIVKSDEETVDEKVLEKKVKVDKKIKKKELKENQLFIPDKLKMIKEF